MKITHMTVESTKGWANIARREVADKVVIGIRGDGATGVFDLNVDTRDAGDVADYLRAIQNFAD